MEKIAAWVLNTFGPWAATLLSFGIAIRWLLKDRAHLMRQLKEQRLELEAQVELLRKENREIRERYAKTLLGVSYRQSEAIAVLARERE